MRFTGRRHASAGAAILRALLGLSLLALSACPSSEEPPSRVDTQAQAPAQAQGPAQAQAPPPEVATANLEKTWEWPPDQGDAPDIAADFRECQLRVQRMGTPEGLVALKETAQCMGAKGWKRKAAP